MKLLTNYQLKFYYVSSLFIFQIQVAFSQLPSIEWQKSLGGSADDYSFSVKQTNDGGFIVGGVTSSTDGDVSMNHGESDCWVVKLNSSGDTSWKKTYGGSGEENLNCIIQTSDGGYFFAGGSTSSDGDVSENKGQEDYWVVRLDVEGNLLWEASFGGSSSDEAWSCIQTSDGGFMVAGQTASDDGDVSSFYGSSDCWLVKLDQSGNLVWEKNYGGSNLEFFFYSEIIQTSDDGYIFSIWTNSTNFDVSGNHGGYDGWLVKLDSSGEIIWKKCFGGSATDALCSVEELSDGNLIVAGVTLSDDGDVLNNHGEQDCWILKLSSSGSILWQQSLGGTGDDESFSIHQTFDNGFIVGGYTNSADGDVFGVNGLQDYWVVKLDSSGEISCQKPIGGDSTEWGWKIEECSDGGFVMIGFTNSESGDVTSNHGGNDIWIVKLQIATGLITNMSDLSPIKLFPNPASDHFYVSFESPVTNTTLSIFNSFGQIIFSKQLSDCAIPESVTFGKFLPEGMYQVKIEESENSYITPLMIQH